MKKRHLLFLFLVIFIILLKPACISPKNVIKTELQPQISELEKPIVWKQFYYPELAVGDSIFFYNSVEIIMEGDFFNKELYLDGAINITNNKKVLQKTVPTMTSGKLVSLKKDNNGKITNMYVKFSLVDKTYYFNFKVAQDESFNLNGNAKLFFMGKEYPVLATIKGDVCKLLCVVNIEENVEYIKEEAEGVGF